MCVLDDMGIGFRYTPTAWPSAVKTTRTDRNTDLVILKTAGPLFEENDLLEHLLDGLQPTNRWCCLQSRTSAMMDIQIGRDLLVGEDRR